jgi:hypothetical protein
MREPSLESQLLTVVRELRVLETRLLMLKSRESVNSEKLQAELTVGIDERPPTTRGARVVDPGKPQRTRLNEPFSGSHSRGAAHEADLVWKVNPQLARADGYPTIGSGNG